MEGNLTNEQQAKLYNLDWDLYEKPYTETIDKLERLEASIIQDALRCENIHRGKCWSLIEKDNIQLSKNTPYDMVIESGLMAHLGIDIAHITSKIKGRDSVGKLTNQDICEAIYFDHTPLCSHIDSYFRGIWIHTTRT